MLKTLWTPPTHPLSCDTHLVCGLHGQLCGSSSVCLPQVRSTLYTRACVYAVVWFVCMCMDGHDVLYTCVQNCPGVPVCPHPVGPPVSAQTSGSPSVASGSGPSCVCSARYIDSVSEDQLKPDIHCHAPFYSACQVLCLERVCPALHEQPRPSVPTSAGCLLPCHIPSQAAYSRSLRQAAPLSGQVSPPPHTDSSLHLWPTAGIDFLKKLHLDRVISTRLNPLKVSPVLGGTLVCSGVVSPQPSPPTACPPHPLLALPLTACPPHPLLALPTHCLPSPPTACPPHPLLALPTHCLPSPPTACPPHPLLALPTHCLPSPPTACPPHPLLAFPAHCSCAYQQWWRSLPRSPSETHSLIRTLSLIAVRTPCNTIRQEPPDTALTPPPPSGSWRWCFATVSLSVTRDWCYRPPRCPHCRKHRSYSPTSLLAVCWTASFPLIPTAWPGGRG